ncbi:hypothetical protein TWF718_001619 [Orbilia javanica]|uniref:Uncharacterized protein n=1 Tax=Orbilia javanica TaxID=47235 RepID=A0AAN8N1K7_9PEZI
MRTRNTPVKACIWTIAALILTFAHCVPVIAPRDDNTRAILVPKSQLGPLSPLNSLDEVDSSIIHRGVQVRGLEVDGGPKKPPAIELEHVGEALPPKPKISSPVKSEVSSTHKPKLSSTPKPNTLPLASTQKKEGTEEKSNNGKSNGGGSKGHRLKPNANEPNKSNDTSVPLDPDDDLEDDFRDDDLPFGPIPDDWEDDIIKHSFWIKDSFQIKCADPKHIFKSEIAVNFTRGLLPKNFTWRTFDDTPWMAEQFIREMQESCMEDCSCDDWAVLHPPEARKNDSLSYCKTWQDVKKCEWVFGCQCWAELGDPVIPEKYADLTVVDWAIELKALPLHLKKSNAAWRWNNGPKVWGNRSIGTGFGPWTEKTEVEKKRYYRRPWDEYRERTIAEIQPGYFLYGPDVPFIHGHPMETLRKWKPSRHGEWLLFLEYLYWVDPDRSYRPSRLTAPPDPFPEFGPPMDRDPEQERPLEPDEVPIELRPGNFRRRDDPHPSDLQKPGSANFTCIPRYLALSNPEGIENLCPVPIDEGHAEKKGVKDSNSAAH